MKPIIASFFYMLCLVANSLGAEETVISVEPPTFAQYQNFINKAKDIETELDTFLQEYLSICQSFSSNKFVADVLKNKLETATNGRLEFQQHLRESLSSKYLGTHYELLSSSGAYFNFMQWYSYLIHRYVTGPLQLSGIGRNNDQTISNPQNIIGGTQQLLTQRETDLYKKIEESIQEEWSSVGLRKEALEEIDAWEEIVERHKAFTKSIQKLKAAFPKFLEETLSIIQYPYEGSLLSNPVRESALIDISTWYLDFLEQCILNDA